MVKQTTQPEIISLDTVKSVLSQIDLFTAISKGFITFSKGEAVIPPVGELLFESPPGDFHIKYGYIRSQPYYVVKMASGFYDNPKIGLPSSQGLNLLFDKSTGVLCAIILDEGFLTDIRTAVAGAIAGKALSSPTANCVGVVGTGTQGRLQLEYLRKITDIQEVMYWYKDESEALALQGAFEQQNLKVELTTDLKKLCHQSQIIITTTPSNSFLIRDEWVQPGTHITAIGSDTAEKNEVDPALVDRADIVVVDSLDQSQSRGEIFRARQAGYLKKKRVIELGLLLDDNSLGRQNDQQITIADLTGVAVQDLMISQSVYEKVKTIKK